MTRAEMLSRLHSITPGVELVALSSEYALERTFVCGKGFSYDWVSFDDPWPAVKIADMTDEKLAQLKIKLCDKTLSEDDLKGNQLLAMYEGFENNLNIQDAFSGLQNLILNGAKELYVLCEICGGKTAYRFFSNYEEFAKAFEDEYIHADTKWEDLSEEDLLSWIERLESEFDSIPLCEYDTDNDD